ncbi:MAG: hypothetical protein QOF89_3524 [Acidobacteriota bacterium]|jgi:hypothetical protein|nr:hypothetical protein [Acidobacteriota bacterium]
MPQTCRRSLSLLILGLLSIVGTIGAAGAITLPDHSPSWCGTRKSGLAVNLAIHRDNVRRLEQKRAKGMAVRSVPQASRAGDVAVLIDDGSLIVQPNALDVANFGVQYVPQKKGGLVVSPSSDPVSEEIGNRIDLGDDDARLVPFPKGFRFRFYNKTYTGMFVGSDGHLTFAAPDPTSAARDLDRLISGPPRIAPLFTDLDPSGASGDGGVYVLTGKTKIVVTWLDVPEFGKTDHNTFQAVLYPDGRITFAFGRIDAKEAVVGIAPGGGSAVQLVDYTESLPTGVIKVAVAERFVATRSFDHLAVAKAFFREFADDYDHLVVFLDFQQSLGPGAFAFEITVKNDVRGIGDGIFDFSAQVGSKGRLRSFVQMGTLARYPDDPDAKLLGTNSTLDVLGQETGHRWLAKLHFLDGNGEKSDALLGRDLAHWSFCHNTLASDMEGNEFREDGGNRFTTIAATERYSPLDQYAMGLIPASDVPPFYYVDGCFDPAAAPAIGTTIQGNRIDLTIGDIIAAEGPRVPAAAKAPHSFKMAFILVAQADQFPSEDSIAKVDRIRAAWEPYFAQAVDGHGTVSTALKPRK